MKVIWNINGVIICDVIKSDLNDSTKLYLVKNLFDTSEKRMDKDLEKFILNKIEERNKAKSEKNYEVADIIRKELFGKGIELIDTREGTTYKII